MKRNFQYSTSNLQCPTLARHGLIGWRMFFLFFASAAGPLYGQTNALPPLSPPYGELPATFWEQHGISVILAGLGVIALVVFGVWLVLRPPPKIIVPPEILARQALESLRQQPEDGACLSRISQVLRNYFIAAFQLAPGEFTTAEFSRTLAGCEQIETGMATEVADFLRDCDGRKFSTATALAPLGAADRALQLIALAEERRAQLRQSAETQRQVQRA
jgi:hypothetical protein